MKVELIPGADVPKTYGYRYVWDIESEINQKIRNKENLDTLVITRYRYQRCPEQTELPLNWSIKNNKNPLLLTLLRQGASPLYNNAQNECAFTTAINEAHHSDTSYYNEESFKHLIQRLLHYTTRTRFADLSPFVQLARSYHLATIPTLIEQYPAHYQKLFKAIDDNDEKTVKNLLMKTTCLFFNENGDTPLSHALRYNKKEIMVRMLFHANPYAVLERNSDGFTPLYYMIGMRPHLLQNLLLSQSKETINDKTNS